LNWKLKHYLFPNQVAASAVLHYQEFDQDLVSLLCYWWQPQWWDFFLLEEANAPFLGA
jgi:hypothetical protein